MSLLPAFCSGALLAGGLIVAMGPQNLQVLRAATVRRHALPVIALCIGADVVLIGLAVAGASEAVASRPQCALALQWLAIPMLLWMTALSLRSAMNRQSSRSAAGACTGGARSLRVELGRTALVTFGNPAVWIETVLIVGAAAASQGEAAMRWSFAAGACAASATWFGSLGCAAQRLAPWLGRDSVLRALSGISASLLAVTAWKLMDSVNGGLFA